MKKEAEETAAAHQKEAVAKTQKGKAREKEKMQQKASHRTKANRPPEVNPLVDRKIANRVMTSARESAKEETNVIFGTSRLAKRLKKESANMVTTVSFPTPR